MNKNKLIIAAAGSGKTTHLVNEALEIKNEKVLITTYTQANELEIRKKIIRTNKCIPENIIVQTWFSFLLKDGVRPFQGALFEKKIKGLILVNSQSGIQFYKNSCQDCKQEKVVKESCSKCKNPVYWGEDSNFDKHYFTKDLKIFSDKLSKFVFRCNEKTNGNVIDRISRIYSHIFIDEVQDLAGYDLELLKLFFACNSNILLVGDLRQVVYLTHNERKHSKYAYGKIKEFIEQECPKNCCQFETLDNNYRCNQSICDFSDKLYPNLPKTTSQNNTSTEHDGIFLIKQQDIDAYFNQYEPIQLRDSKKTTINEEYSVMNFGESKGLSFDRVLIYPTNPILKWLKNNDSVLADTSRSKFYVAITRARYSVGIVVDNDYNENQFPFWRNDVK
ncbi:MAG: UvrD-helicase domain-containing protein [Prevotellaceae bacterium]|jgi:superfamily I DNA/RNA helicase|nr:UvrD-helicase domain-containing protein [Prevotellaceae bacterium]